MALVVHHLHLASAGQLEGLVVGAVLLGLLRHQPDVGHGAHRRHVELAILAAVLQARLVHRRVAAVGDDADDILERVLLVPHLAAVAHDARHRRVDDDVRGHVQVGDAARRVDHRQPGPRRVARVDRLLDRRLVRRAHRLHPIVQVAEAVVRVEAGRGDRLARLSSGVDQVLEEDGDRVPEEDWVRDLHHGRLEVERDHHALALCLLQRRLVEGAQLGHVHPGGVDHLARLELDLGLEHLDRAVALDELDAHRARGGPLHVGLLGGVEVALLHVRHARPTLRLPLPQPVRVLLRVRLDGRRDAPVRVALAQDRVDGRAEDRSVALVRVLLRRGARRLHEIGQREPLGLQLGDSLHQLRHRRRHIRKLDDVGLRSLCELAELAERVGLALLGRQDVGKRAEDPPGDRDVGQLELNVGPFRHSACHREEGIGRQRRCLVRVRVHDFGRDEAPARRPDRRHQRPCTPRQHYR
mmetsp:Transcript_1094/g.2938  ORF Transcript_1094/g.2938 Transcript_1094/m.2938 type:complete len:469 (-) Transcript_1094:27-1433(-)